MELNPISPIITKSYYVTYFQAVFKYQFDLFFKFKYSLYKMITLIKYNYNHKLNHQLLMLIKYL